MEKTSSRRLLAVVGLAALVAGCGPNQPAPVPRDLVVGGKSQFIGLGGTSQLTVHLRLTDYTETDLPGAAEWLSSDPKVASVSPDGVVTASAFGSAVISIRYQSLLARKTVLVLPLTLIGLGVTTDLAFSAAGQARQLTAIVRSNDDSTTDVTAETQWTSSDPSIFDVSPSGTLTATGFGTATLTMRYATMTSTAAVSVFPPGGVFVAGRVRLPGNGGGGAQLGVPGFTVTNTDLGYSVVSNSDGRYGIVAAIGTRLTFEKADFEPAELVVSGPAGDPTVQRLIRLTAGDTTQTTIFENDITYDPSPAFHCDNCRLIRVVSPAAGTLHVQIDWSIFSSALALWTRGVKYDPTGVRQLIADIPVDAGESELYIRAGFGGGSNFTIKTSFVPSQGGGLWE